MTSPPYWGLRDYGVEPQVWGGDPDCNHEWQEHRVYVEGGGAATSSKEAFTKPGEENAKRIKQARWRRYSVCHKCNATRTQLGLERLPQEYLERIVGIFSDLKRVLKPHGSLYLNLGDTYCSTKGSCLNAGGGVTSVPQPAFKALALRKNPNRMLKPDGHWLQPKQLLMIPARVAVAMQEDGWILRNDIIWHKPNGLPSSVKDRLTNKYEHLFHFVKSPRYFYDLDAIRVPHKSLQPQGQSRRASEGRTERTERHLLGLRKAGTGYLGHRYGKNPGDVIVTTGANTGQNNKAPYSENNKHFARVLYSSKEAMYPAGKNPGDIVEIAAETRAFGSIIGKKGVAKVPFGKGWVGHPPGGMARILREQDSRWLSANGKNPGDFWNVSTKPFPEAHFAVYPEALCEQPIKAACPAQVCIQCGVPRQRITCRAGYAGRRRDDDGHPRHLPGFRERESRSQWGEQPIHATTGWTSCSCKAGFRPGIVFDPFAGAGTTLVVAKKLGRFYLGCELNPAYVKLAKRRLQVVHSISPVPTAACDHVLMSR